MTEELKKFAKEEYGKELTDEEAKALAEKLEKGGELSDDDLETIAGGAWQDRSAIEKVIKFTIENRKNRE